MGRNELEPWGVGNRLTRDQAVEFSVRYGRRGWVRYDEGGRMILEIEMDQEAWDRDIQALLGRGMEEV